MPKRTRNYHDFLNEHLLDPEFAADYLSAAAKESPKMLPVAMRNIAEAHKMSRVAARAKVNRESLYKTLSAKGNPRLDTFASILEAFGIQVGFAAKKHSHRTAARKSKITQAEPRPRAVARSGRK
jgi:probable addiction module antidote protein